jgi:hypothetical protein
MVGRLAGVERTRRDTGEPSAKSTTFSANASAKGASTSIKTVDTRLAVVRPL